MIKPACIIDLDNCLSDDQWRLPLIQHHHVKPNDRYWEYHEVCHRDLPGARSRSKILQLSNNYKLLVFTSRPEVVRDKTRCWLHKWGIPHFALFMRPNDNQQTSVDLKREMLSWAAKSPSSYQIEYAIDDRQDILDMYKSEGIARTERVFIYQPEIIHP
jgi:hypothetical protein